MLMAPYYTEVPRRSFEAIVKNGWLSEILLALITDHLEAEDLAERLERKDGEQLWVLPAANGERRYLAPISVGDFRELNIEAKTSWRVTMSQWAMHFEEATSAIRSLTAYDYSLGVWCACQVAREGLRFVPYGEDRPRVAIELAESSLTQKRRTADSMRIAANGAYAAADDADASYTAYASYAASSAAVAAGQRTDALRMSAYAAASVAIATNAADAVDCISKAVAYASGSTGIAWTKTRDAERVRLREVVANACMTFPM